MAKSDKIKDVPVLSSLNGTEKIPTGGRGKFTTTITQISDYISGALVSLINNKVDKVTGKGLSTEDYTTVEKIKLAGIEQGAEVNVNADWNSTSGDSEILNKPDLLQLGETDTTAYRGDRGKVAYDHTLITTGNPHQVTKAEVGLGNADNTSDVDKPISTAQQAAFDTKLEELSSPSLTGTSLHMAKNGMLGRLKKIITSGTDLSITSAADLVTITLAGSTIKLWEELSGTVVSKFSRTFRVKRQGSEAATTPVNVYLAGAYATANATTAPEYYYAVSLADPSGHNGTGDLGYGAIDLQIRRDNTSSIPSGNYSVAIGHRNSVAGTNSVCISANTNANKTVSSSNSYFMGSSATITGTSGSNYLIGGGTMSGSSGDNYVFGYCNFSGSASKNSVVGTLTGTPFFYSVLGQTVGTFSAEQNIILSSISPPYGNITDRNMKGVMVVCTSRKLNTNTYPQQTVRIGVTNTAGNAQNQTWVTMTTNDPLGLQTPSTTNVYKLPHTGLGNAVAFCGYVSVYGAAGHRLMKIEGSVYRSTVTFSKTHLGGTTSDDAVIDARVVESSGYLYIQFKGDIAASNSLYGSAIFDFFELF